MSKPPLKAHRVSLSTSARRESIPTVENRPLHSKHPNDGGGLFRELFHKVLLKQIL
jgi:hypothetical protein